LIANVFVVIIDEVPELIANVFIIIFEKSISRSLKQNYNNSKRLAEIGLDEN
jgi:hypothetical protein